MRLGLPVARRFYFQPSFQSSVHEMTSPGSSSAWLHLKNTVRKRAVGSPWSALDTAGPFVALILGEFPGYPTPDCLKGT